MLSGKRGSNPLQLSLEPWMRRDPIDRNGYVRTLNGGAVAMLRFSIFIFWAFLVKNVKGSWAAIDGGIWKVRRVY